VTENVPLFRPVPIAAHTAPWTESNSSRSHIVITRS
jgi:hypothetical protein